MGGIQENLRHYSAYRFHRFKNQFFFLPSNSTFTFRLRKGIILLSRLLNENLKKRGKLPAQVYKGNQKKKKIIGR